LLLLVPLWLGLSDFFFTRGDYASSLAVAPFNGRAALHLGLERLQAGDPARACSSLDRAGVLYPDLQGQLALGNCLTESGRWDAAEAAYGKAIGWKPTFAAAYANLSILFTRKGEHDKACRHATRARSLLPGSPRYKGIHARACTHAPQD
jgi:tetratricopeptide (TPR) repeat protein